MSTVIRTTTKQHKQLMDQHVGTDFLSYKESDSSTVTVEFFIKDGILCNIHTGKPLSYTCYKSEEVN